MGIFGWSYPPGCHSVPGDENVPCSVCGGMDVNPQHVRPGVYACICPECPGCSDFGNPDCYKPVAEGGHGLVLSEAQKAQAQEVLKAQEKRDEEEAAAYAEDRALDERYRKELEGEFSERVE